jgi:uncharacterized repeat protein (TIGR01451 family)
LATYQNSYDPNDQSSNYLGDVGLSTAQPFSLTVPAGESLVLVAQNTTQLIAACNFEFTISQVPCQSAALIEISPPFLSETLLQETMLTDTLAIANHGLPELTWTISNTEPWVNAAPSAGISPGNSSSTVDVFFNTSGLAAGVYTGTLTIESNDTTNPAIAVPLTMTVEASVDLGITKYDAPDPVFAGQPLTYTLEVTNYGISDATGVTLTDTLPAGVVYGSSIMSQGSCTFLSGTVSCSLGNLPVSSSLQVTISVTAPDSAGIITNLAEVSGNETDPAPANNHSSSETTVLIPGDLALTKLDDPDPVYAGNTLTYTISIANNGGSDITGVILTDTLPAGVGYLFTTPSQGVCDQVSGMVTCVLGSLSPGFPTTISIVVTAPPDAGTLLNQASVAGSEFDPDLTNNTASATTGVLAEADLSLAMQAAPWMVNEGEVLTYTLTVLNEGPSTATGVTLIDILPVSGTYLSANPSQGVCDFDGGTVTCNLGSLGAGQSTVVSIQISADTTGTLLNQASVSAIEFDPDQADNNASHQIEVGMSPFLIYIPSIYQGQ